MLAIVAFAPRFDEPGLYDIEESEQCHHDNGNGPPPQCAGFDVAPIHLELDAAFSSTFIFDEFVRNSSSLLLLPLLRLFFGQRFVRLGPLQCIPVVLLDRFVDGCTSVVKLNPLFRQIVTELSSMRHQHYHSTIDQRASQQLMHDKFSSLVV